MLNQLLASVYPSLNCHRRDNEKDEKPGASERADQSHLIGALSSFRGIFVKLAIRNRLDFGASAPYLIHRYCPAITQDHCESRLSVSSAAQLNGLPQFIELLPNQRLP